jgi:hypothetical protein
VWSFIFFGLVEEKIAWFEWQWEICRKFFRRLWQSYMMEVSICDCDTPQNISIFKSRLTTSFLSLSMKLMLNERENNENEKKKRWTHNMRRNNGNMWTLSTTTKFHQWILSNKNVCETITYVNCRNKWLFWRDLNKKIETKLSVCGLLFI